MCEASWCSAGAPLHGEAPGATAEPPGNRGQEQGRLHVSGHPHPPPLPAGCNDVTTSLPCAFMLASQVISLNLTPLDFIPCHVTLRSNILPCHMTVSSNLYSHHVPRHIVSFRSSIEGRQALCASAYQAAAAVCAAGHVSGVCIGNRVQGQVRGVHGRHAHGASSRLRMAGAGWCATYRDKQHTFVALICSSLKGGFPAASFTTWYCDDVLPCGASDGGVTHLLGFYVAGLCSSGACNPEQLLSAEPYHRGPG